MIPIIGRDLTSLTDTEWLTWIADRRRARTITPGRKPRAKTVSALARAWNVSPETIIRGLRILRLLPPEEVPGDGLNATITVTKGMI